MKPNAWRKFCTIPCSAILFLTLLGQFAVAGQSTELIANGGFEQGLNGWQAIGLVGDYRTSTDAQQRSGSRSLILDLLPPYQSSPTESFLVGVIQRINSPRFTFNLTFSFWVRPAHSSLNVEIYGFLIFTLVSGGQKANRTLAYYVAYPQGSTPGEIGPHWRSLTLDNISPTASNWNKWNGYTRNVRTDFQTAFGLTALPEPIALYVGLAIKTTTTVTNDQLVFWDDISLKAPSAEIPEFSNTQRLAVLAVGFTLITLLVVRTTRRRA